MIVLLCNLTWHYTAEKESTGFVFVFFGFILQRAQSFKCAMNQIKTAGDLQKVNMLPLQELNSRAQVSQWPARSRGIGSTRTLTALWPAMCILFKETMMTQLKACIAVKRVIKRTISTCREEVSDSSTLANVPTICQSSLPQTLSSFFKCATTALNWTHLKCWWPSLWTCCWRCWWCWSPTSAPRRGAQQQLHTLPKVGEIHKSGKYHET